MSTTFTLTTAIVGGDNLNINPGQEYIVVLESGYEMKGVVDDIKFIGDQLFSFWIDIGGQPVYINVSEVKEVIPILK